MQTGEKGAKRVDKMLSNKNSNGEFKKKTGRNTQQSIPKNINELITHAGPWQTSSQASTDQIVKKQCDETLHTPFACRIKHINRERRYCNWIFVRLINFGRRSDAMTHCHHPDAVLNPSFILRSFICEHINSYIFLFSFSSKPLVRYHQVVCLIIFFDHNFPFGLFNGIPGLAQREINSVTKWKTKWFLMKIIQSAALWHSSELFRCRTGIALCCSCVREYCRKSLLDDGSLKPTHLHIIFISSATKWIDRIFEWNVIVYGRQTAMLGIFRIHFSSGCSAFDFLRADNLRCMRNDLSLCNNSHKVSLSVCDCNDNNHKANTFRNAIPCHVTWVPVMYDYDYGVDEWRGKLENTPFSFRFRTIPFEIIAPFSVHINC